MFSCSSFPSAYLPCRPPNVCRAGAHPSEANTRTRDCGTDVFTNTRRTPPASSAFSLTPPGTTAPRRSCRACDGADTPPAMSKTTRCTSGRASSRPGTAARSGTWSDAGPASSEGGGDVASAYPFPCGIAGCAEADLLSGLRCILDFVILVSPVSGPWCWVRGARVRGMPGF